MVAYKRFITLEGDIEENNYSDGQYFVNGVDVGDAVIELQRDVLGYVSDEDRQVVVDFSVSVAPDNGVNGVTSSGVARFVGVPLENGERNVTTHDDSWNGMVVEAGIGRYYIVTEAENKNLSAAITRLVGRGLHSFAERRASVVVNVELAVRDIEPVKFA